MFTILRRTVRATTTSECAPCPRRLQITQTIPRGPDPKTDIAGNMAPGLLGPVRGRNPEGECSTRYGESVLTPAQVILNIFQAHPSAAGLADQRYTMHSLRVGGTASPASHNMDVIFLLQRAYYGQRQVEVIGGVAHTNVEETASVGGGGVRYSFPGHRRSLLFRKLSRAHSTFPNPSARIREFSINHVSRMSLGIL